MSVAVWIRPPNGSWTPVGEIGSPRIVPSSLHVEADEWGVTQGSFTLTVEGSLPIGLLQPWGRIIVEVDGLRVAQGSVRDSVRTAPRAVTVNFAGTQMELDGPIFDMLPVDTRLSQWSDDLTTANGWTSNTSNQIGVPIRLAWSQATSLNGAGLYPADYNAVTYLQRPAQAVGLIVQLHVPAAIPNLRFGVHTIDVMPSGSLNSPLALWLAQGGDGNGIYRWGAQTISSVGDYTFTFFTGGAAGDIADLITMGVWLNASGTQTIPKGTAVSITNITAVDDPSYIDTTNKVSVLVASDIAARAADMTPNVSSDLSGVEQTSATIQAFVEQQQTPRQILTDAMAFDDAACKIDADDRLVFMPRATAPSLEIGRSSPPSTETPIDPTSLIAGAQLTLSDSGAVIFYSVLDLPETPRTAVTSGPLQGGVPYWIANITAGYYSLFGPLYDPSGTLVSAMVGDKANWHQTRQAIGLCYFGDVSTVDPTDDSCPMSFMPREDWAQPAIDIGDGTGPTSIYAAGNPVTSADYGLFQAAGLFAGVTAVGTFSLPAGRISQLDNLPIAQTYLRAENALGLTQQRTVGDGGAHDAQTGASLPAVALLSHASELARFADRVDPADGKLGALGSVSGVIYDHGPRQAQLTVGLRYGSVDELTAVLSARAERKQ